VTGRHCAWLLPLLLSGCPATPGEPPPPAAKLEIPLAPPRARGALAAGTDAAPKPDGLPPEAEPEPAAPVPPPAGSVPDAGAPAPEPEPAAPSAPDAGMAL
jgi:hypothetical protein